MKETATHTARACDWCGNPFVPKRRHQRFCSELHTTAYHTREKQAALAVIKAKTFDELQVALDGVIAWGRERGTLRAEPGAVEAWRQAPGGPQAAPAGARRRATKADAIELLARHAGHTCAELAEGAGLDPNSLAPRLSDLVPGHAHTRAPRICKVTGKRVKTWHAGPRAPTAAEEREATVLLALIDHCDLTIDASTADGLPCADQRRAWERERRRLAARLFKLPRG